MKTGDTLELKVDDIGSNGEGIAHYEEYTVFIPFALPGESIKAKITHVKRNLAYGIMTHILQESPHRVPPVCPVYYRCGGCNIMHLQYDAQLLSKRQNLINILRKNTGYTGEVKPAIPSPNQFFYRNKIQLPFGRLNGETVLGFYKPGTHILVPLTKCHLHGDWADKLIKIVSAFADKNKLTVYDESTGRGLLRHLVARYIDSVLVVTLVINGRQLKNADSLISALKSEFNNASLYLSVNTKRTNVILGSDLIPVYAPKQTITVQGIKVEINPMSFFQINDDIRDKIYSATIAEIAPDNNTAVIDAYSGVGLLGAIMAKKGAQIYNIEIVPEAIADANKLYLENKITATNICGDAGIELPKLIPSIAAKVNNSAVVLDPPRKGCDPAVLDALISNPVEKLIYISCNPATLSRDLATLLPTYTIKSITPYDMFPNTQHLEVLVVMSRR